MSRIESEQGTVDPRLRVNPSFQLDPERARQRTEQNTAWLRRRVLARLNGKA